MRTNKIILISIFASVISIFSCLTIPVGAVPVSLSMFGIFLSAVVLGGKMSFLSAILYIMIGCVGLPVFSGFRGGINVILGPTGGYIASYPIAALISGFIAERTENTKYNFLFSVLANILSLAVTYIFGTLHFSFVTETDVHRALVLCVYPFLLFDILKCVFAGLAGVSVKRRLRKL